MNSSPLTRNDYTIACICPMGLEQAPLVALLDETHPILPTSLDKNSYTLGRMGAHNIAIAAMPEIGNNSAASVATQLLNDFPAVRFALLVGIGGGVPDLDEGVDVRLGDVVVSKPEARCGGVVQFDRGKALADGRFERTGALQRPPDVLLGAVARLKARHQRVESEIPRYLQEMIERYPKMKEGGYTYQGAENDQLFRAEFEHAGGKDCRGCDPEEIVERESRRNLSPVVHYGTIGSSNAVIKDGRVRDMLRDELNVKCVEMEAAGLMESFPCLVIRGICDYADSHKNKRWQPYAAATAAAYAKELLSLIPPLERLPRGMEENKHAPPRGSTKILMGNAGNFINGSVSGDVVAGDKVNGDKILWGERW
jgi:nucleoside phosphorylase